MALPPFTPDGLLPPGDYPMTFAELRDSYLVGRGVRSRTWDTAWRRHLVDNLQILVSQLWQVGINDVFADGSFVEEKDHPNDIDGYFVCDLRYFASGQLQLQRDLNAMDPYKIWTWDRWSRRPDPQFDEAPTADVAPISDRSLPALRQFVRHPGPVWQRS